MNEIVFENFKNQLIEYGFDVTQKQLDQFKMYYKLLVEWNEKMNLTAITEYEDVLMKHFLDSVSIIKVNNFENIDSVIDIGTGAGFPGIPLKIMFPEIKITLLDSLQKRIGFLNAVISELDLKDVETIHGRAEDFARDNVYREKYDLCVSRAVANLSVLVEFLIPAVKIGGKIICMKGSQIEEELNSSKNAIKILGGKIESVDKFNIPGSDYGRSMVIIKKVKDTPKQYPRKAGVPTKNPLFSIAQAKTSVL